MQILWSSFFCHWHKSGYLRSDKLLWLLWPIAATILGALLWSVTFSKIALERAALDRETLREASGFATIYAQRLTHLIEQADQTTRLVKYCWEHSRGNMNAASMAKQGIFPSSPLLHVVIADRNGNQIVRSAPGTFPNVADRDYFIEHKGSKSDLLLVGTPEIKRGIGKGVLRFSRRLDAPDGQFDGVVTLSVDQAFFSDFFGSSGLGSSGFISMTGLGGSLHMAMIAGVADSLAHPLLTSIPIFRAEGARLLKGRPWFADHRPRFVAWSPFKSYPFVASVGLAKDESYVRYEMTWAAYKHYALMGTILLFCFALASTFLAEHLTIRNVIRKNTEQSILSSQTELRILYDRLQTIWEEERVALAREVHDQLGQVLSAAKIDIKLLEDDIRSVDAPLSRRKISRELRSARQSIENAIRSVREIAANLRSPELEDHGLFAMIEWHARDFERRTRIKCTVAISDAASEPGGLSAIVLFRIFQEATTNVLRHAKASEVWVSLDRRGAMMLLRVRDNGIGIGPALARSNHSMGIKGMRERVTIVKGRLLVAALQPQGTLVSARVPIIADCHAPRLLSVS